MGVVTMTIGGINVLPYLQVRSLSVEHYLNNRPVLRCRLRVRDGDPDYTRPNVYDEVIFSDDNGPPLGNVRLFGGIVFSVKETDVVDYKHRDLDIDCTGYEIFADNVLINGIVSGTTRQILQKIVDNLAPHGISLDTGMPMGSTQPDQAFPWYTCRQAMDQLATVSGWNWKFDFDKKVRLYDPASTIGAPFALDENNGEIVSLQHTKTLARYVNEVWAQFGESKQLERTDKWTGDGSNIYFGLHYPPVGPPSTVVEDTTTHPVSPTVNAAYRWSFNPAWQRLEITNGVAPGAAVPIKSTFMAQLPGAVFVRNDTEYALRKPWTIVVQYPEIDDFEKALSAAQGELNRRVGVVRRLTAATYRPGLEPGMTINVSASKRGLSSTNFLIERVSIKHETKKPDGSHLFLYEIEALEGNQYQANWLDYFRNLQGKTGASGGVSLTGGSGGGSTTTTVTIPHVFWGGSRQFGLLLNNAWADAIDFLKIRFERPTGTSGAFVTVRAMQRSASGGVNVQVRIVRSDTLAVMTTGATSPGTAWDEEILTFTPDEGVHDYHLQVYGSSNSAQVFALAASL
jgi:hypothetical protein